ncbi:MAG: hypothetical protein ACD_46C00456G0005 [uncultured bacterium]|nr:MAG: hypothetical protein ACD_46C00456G0005 [uncultured bacterium]
MMTLESSVIEFNIANRTFKSLSLNDLNVTEKNKDKIYWIHCNLNQTGDLIQLTEKLHLSDEVINLCHQEETIAKIIDTDETLTIQIQCLLSTELNNVDEVNYSNLIIHLTSNYCFTASYEPLPVLIEFSNTYQKALRYAKTPCFILFLLLDNTVNDYAKILFNLELFSEKMDINVRRAHDNTYNKVMEMKQQIMKMKRHMIAVREILMRISGRKIAVVSEQCRASLYNLSNHSHLVIHEVDSMRDMLNSLLDQIDNSLMQKMNETMRILTTFASIFFPLTLITGIYGMNFHWIPELSWKYGYFYALGLIIFFAGMMLFIFKKLKWF